MRDSPGRKRQLETKLLLMPLMTCLVDCIKLVKCKSLSEEPFFPRLAFTHQNMGYPKGDYGADLNLAILLKTNTYLSLSWPGLSSGATPLTVFLQSFPPRLLFSSPVRLRSFRFRLDADPLFSRAAAARAAKAFLRDLLLLPADGVTGSVLSA